MPAMRRVMYASDFSPASRPAFKRAIEMAKAARAELIIAHALTPVVPLVGDGAYISAETWNKLEKGARDLAQKQLRGLLDKAKKAGVRTTTLLVEGVPAESLVRAARAKHADVLVIGTHGRTGLQRLLLGSVAARVVAIARCPVLTVRAS